MNFWVANLLTSLLFVGVHLPGWLSLHLFNWPLATIFFAFSFAMGVLFKMTRSALELHHQPRRQQLRLFRAVFTGGSVFTVSCEARTLQLQHVHDFF